VVVDPGPREARHLTRLGLIGRRVLGKERRHVRLAHALGQVETLGEANGRWNVGEELIKESMPKNVNISSISAGVWGR